MQRESTAPSSHEPLSRPPGMHDPVLCAVREVSHIAGCYERHVAGKPRVTRDLHLLDELVERLAGVQDRLAAAPRSHASDAAVRGVAEQRTHIQDARSLIQAARAAATPAERAAFLAARLDEQRILYRVHLAGHPYLSRRPGLLRRILANLQDLQAEAELLDAAILDDRAGIAAPAPDSPFDHTQLAQVQETLGRELDMVELSHLGASTAERIASLGAAANQDIQAYALYFAGQDRATRDLAGLAAICDRMAELEQQMIALALRYHSNALARSLDTVQTCLDLYQQEHAQIRAVQTG